MNFKMLWIWLVVSLHALDSLQDGHEIILKGTPRYNTLKVNALRVLNGYIDNNLTVGNTLTAHSLTTDLFTANEVLITETGYVEGSLIVAGNELINNNLIVTGTGYINNDLFVTANESINGNLMVTGTTTFQSLNVENMTIEGDTVLNDVSILGTFTLNGNLLLSTTANINGSLTVNGQTTLPNLIALENVTAQNNVTLSNNQIIEGNLTALGTSTLAILEVLGNITMENNLVAETGITAGSFALSPAAPNYTLGIPGIGGLLAYGLVIWQNSARGTTINLDGLVQPFSIASSLMSGMEAAGSSGKYTGLTVTNAGIYFYYYFLPAALANPDGTTSSYVFQLVSTSAPEGLNATAYFTPIFGDVTVPSFMYAMGIVSLNAGDTVSIQYIGPCDSFIVGGVVPTTLGQLAAFGLVRLA